MQDKYTRSAQGQLCAVRQIGICNHNPETVVFAHLDGLLAGKALGKKPANIFGAYACSACHEWLGTGYVKTHSRAERDLAHLEGMVRTLQIMIRDRVLKL